MHGKRFMGKKNKIDKDKDDDGRVIADMSMIDGLSPGISFHKKNKAKQKVVYDDHGNPITVDQSLELTKEEKRQIAWGVIKAHLLYAGLGLLLLIAVFFFIMKVWLH